MQLRTRIAAALLAAAIQCPAMLPSPAAERSFQSYIAKVEARLARLHASPETYPIFLNLNAAERTAAERQLASGAIQIMPINRGTWEVSGALLHDWRGTFFVPGATAGQMLTLLRDYNHFARYYAPEVVASHVLADHGKFTLIDIRFKKHVVITVVLEAEYQVEAALIGRNRGYSWSRSRHIWQIDEPGTLKERRRAENDGDGFLWHLNSYWNFIQWRGGLLIECEAVSLTRDVPAGFGWVVTPIVEDLPRNSLQFTLRATKRALAASNKKEVER